MNNKYYLLLEPVTEHNRCQDWKITVSDTMSYEDEGAEVSLVSNKVNTQKTKSQKWALYYWDGKANHELFRFNIREPLKCLKGIG